MLTCAIVGLQLSADTAAIRVTGASTAAIRVTGASTAAVTCD